MARHWSQQFPSLPCFSFLTTGKLRLTKEIPFRPGKTQEQHLRNNVDLGAPLLPSARCLIFLLPWPLCAVFMLVARSRETDPVTPDLLTCILFP